MAIIVGILYCILQSIIVFAMNVALGLSASGIILAFIVVLLINATIGGMLTGIIGGENDYSGNISQTISKFLPEELAREMNEKTKSIDTSKKTEINIKSILSDSITGALNGLSTLVFTVFFYLLFIRTEQDFKQREIGGR